MAQMTRQGWAHFQLQLILFFSDNLLYIDLQWHILENLTSAYLHLFCFSMFA